MKKIILIFTVVYLVVFSEIQAQNDSIPAFSADRPTYSIAPVVVPKRFFQIETGVLFQKESTDFADVRDMYLGQTLLRYGLFDNFELRFSASYREQKITPKNTDIDSVTNGVNPISVGLKFRIFDGKGVLPELGFEADMTLRHIGKDGFHPTYSYPTARILANNVITRNFSFLYNFGFAYNGESADGFFIWSGALVYTVFNKASLYAEMYGSFDHNNMPTNNVDFGFMYVLGQNMQLDISGGTSFTSTVSYINGGFTWRIPR
jgi:hypothetical protein